MSTLTERLSRPGPKRILALDGGGIRGALTLGFLERMEAILRNRYQNPDLRLCEYFDLIGGTSTGSIIAAALATGATVGEIRDQYLDMGGKIFGKKKKPWIPGSMRFLFLNAQYDHGPLEEALYNFFEDTRLGDQERLKTGLCIVTKRADTFSTWPIHNFPTGKYYGSNKDYLLRDLVRASSAAPTFFEPKKMKVSANKDGIFIDGGVSLANNPAFQLLLLSTLKGYSLGWKLAPGELFLVSVGTGTTPNTMDLEEVEGMKMIGWAEKIPDLFMQDANFFNQALLQWLSDSPTAKEIDGEIGDLREDQLHEQKSLEYIRYNIPLFQDSLHAATGKIYSEEEVRSLRQMDQAKNRFALSEIGSKAAEDMVQAAHFPPAFDLNPAASADTA